MHTTCRDIVRRYIRLLGLAYLEAEIDQLGGESRLRLLSADSVEAILFSPVFRNEVGRGTSFLASSEFEALIDNILTEYADGNGFSLPRIVDTTDLDSFRSSLKTVSARDKVAATIEAGIAIVSACQSDALSGLISSIDIVNGIDGPEDEIVAYSNPAIPGFVAINVNAQPIIVGEMLIHEAAHSVTSALLALDPLHDRLFFNSVGVLSPFTDTARTPERVFHGIVSYACVREYWVRLAEFDCGLRKEVIDRRIDTLSSRVSLAIHLLADGVGRDVAMKSIYHTLDRMGIESEWLEWRDVNSDLFTLNGYSRSAELKPIQQAELLLAAHGHKVSRISSSMADLKNIGFAIAGQVPTVVSGSAFIQVDDEKLGGFSNVAICSDFSAARSEDLVHLYVACDIELARQAACLDAQNCAGELFEIPKCCRNWFDAAWPKVVTNGGDAFAHMIRLQNRSHEIYVSPECDASAMYRGGGLCWHFPCSPHCENTISLIKQRRLQLEKINPKLLKELELAKRDTILLTYDGVYVEDRIFDEGSILIRYDSHLFNNVV